MSNLTEKGDTARRNKGVLCSKCEHLNFPAENTCKKCGAHLYVSCVECGHRNERVHTRCASCGRRLHRGILQKIRKRLFGKNNTLSPLQIFLLVVGVLACFALIIFLAELSLPGI